MAPVGCGHVHPQIPTATLTRAIDSGHIVVVVVLLRGTETEPRGSVISQVNWSLPSAPSYLEFPGSSGPEHRSHRFRPGSSGTPLESTVLSHSSTDLAFAKSTLAPFGFSSVLPRQARGFSCNPECFRL